MQYAQEAIKTRAKYGPEPSGALSFDQLGTIASELDDLLLPYTIDLSIFEQLGHPELREHIERVGVFYERQT